jgi:hypothetical protein
MSMGSIHTLPVKSWVGHGYSLVSAGILIPYLFIVNLLCDTSYFVELRVRIEECDFYILLIVTYSNTYY